MKKLLRLYILDYIKKSLLGLLLALIVGFFLFYTVADGLEERILFINWTVYVALYGLYFYNYPLVKISKWSMNIPVSNERLVGFNIIFQISKIMITMSILFLIHVLEFYIFGKIPYFEKSITKINSFVDTVGIKQLEIMHSDFLGTEYLLTLIVLLSFLLAFLFNIAPYEFFNNRGMTWDSFTNLVRFIKTKYFKHVFITALIVTISLALKDYFYSKAFLGGVCLLILCLFVYFTYSKFFLFKRRMEYIYLCLSIMIGCLTWFGLFTYSQNILMGKKITFSQKISELEFQGRAYIKITEKEIEDMLSRPEICGRDIGKLLKSAKVGEQKKYIIFSDSYIKGFPAYEHQLKKLDFNKVVLSKTKLCGLRSSIGLFKLSDLTIENIEDYIEKWSQLSKFEYWSNMYLAKKLMGFNFDKIHLLQLLKSPNHLKNYVGLKVLFKKKYGISSHLIFKYAKKYNTANLFLVERFFSIKKCTKITAKDILLKKRLKISNGACRRGRKIASILK